MLFFYEIHIMGKLHIDIPWRLRETAFPTQIQNELILTNFE